MSLRPKQSRNEVVEESSLTLDSIKPKIREEREKASSASVPKPQDDPARTDSHSPQKTQPQSESPALETGLKTSPEELEEEAGQEAAFNPETGEINWDCPCLGGMAHGPCGEEFKAAFSCFVYSSEEPKGIDCIDKFKYELTPTYIPASTSTDVCPFLFTTGACRTVSDSILTFMVPSWKMTRRKSGVNPGTTPLLDLPRTRLRLLYLPQNETFHQIPKRSRLAPRMFDPR